jgi:hypothetical protein
VPLHGDVDFDLAAPVRPDDSAEEFVKRDVGPLRPQSLESLLLAARNSLALGVCTGGGSSTVRLDTHSGASAASSSATAAL